jgi:hypothetical protein
MTIGELVYKITGDSKGLQTEVQKSDSKVKGLGATFGKFAKLGVAAIAAVGVAMATKITKELVNAASMAEETQNKFDVVFRGIEGSADAAAKNLQDNFGLSGTAAQRMLSDTGDLLVGLGLTADEALVLADNAAQLGTDLASFTNFAGGAEGATDALRKAMLGETESAKALGLVLGETQLKEYADRHGLVVSQLTLAEKAQIRLQMAMEQSVNAIGDFERSSDSFANQSRIAQAAVEDLKVAMGEGLLPIATASVSAFAGLTKKLTEFIEERKKLKEAEEAASKGLATTQQEIILQEQRIQGLKDQLAIQQRTLEASKNIPGVNKEIIESQIAATNAQIRSAQTAFSSLMMRADAEERVLINQRQAEADAVAAEQAAIERAEAEAVRLEQEEERKAELAEAESERIQRRIDDIQGAADHERGLREAELAFEELELEKKKQIADAEIKLEEAKQAARKSAFEGFLALTSLGAEKSIELFNLNKGLASADALINSYLAFTKTLTDGGPFPFNTINAAGVLAAGLAQQIKILGQKPPQFASGGIVPSAPGVPTTGDRMLAAVNPGEVILNESQQRNLVNKIGGGNGGNMTIRIIPQEFSKFLQAQFDNQEVFIR